MCIYVQYIQEPDVEYVPPTSGGHATLLTDPRIKANVVRGRPIIRVASLHQWIDPVGSYLEAAPAPSKIDHHALVGILEI